MGESDQNLKNHVQIAIRLSPSVLEQVDAIAKRMSRSGVKITRTEVLRMLIERGAAKEMGSNER